MAGLDQLGPVPSRPGPWALDHGPGAWRFWSPRGDWRAWLPYEVQRVVAERAAPPGQLAGRCGSGSGASWNHLDQRPLPGQLHRGEAGLGAGAPPGGGDRRVPAAARRPQAALRCTARTEPRAGAGVWGR